MTAPLPTDTLEERLLRTQRLFERLTASVKKLMGSVRSNLLTARVHLLAGQPEEAIKIVDKLTSNIDWWAETIRKLDETRPS